jgi:hypothetical protein
LLREVRLLLRRESAKTAQSQHTEANLEQGRPLYFVDIERTRGDSIRAALEGDSQHLQCVVDANRASVVAPLLLAADRRVPFYFAFVRNPYARAVSMWATWHTNVASHGDATLAACGCEHGCSFDTWLASCWTTSAQPWLRPQRSLLLRESGARETPAMAQTRFDYLGRTEGLPEFLVDLLRAAGYTSSMARACAAAQRLALRRHHGSSHADYRSYYTRPATRALADRLFASDLLAFNYTFDGVLGASAWVGNVEAGSLGLAVPR